MYKRICKCINEVASIGSNIVGRVASHTLTTKTLSAEQYTSWSKLIVLSRRLSSVDQRCVSPIGPAYNSKVEVTWHQCALDGSFALSHSFCPPFDAHLAEALQFVKSENIGLYTMRMMHNDNSPYNFGIPGSGMVYFILRSQESEHFKGQAVRSCT
jgi:hypothetical protein